MSKHTLLDVRAEYRRLDKLCGVSTEHIKLKVSARATRRYGFCHYSKRFDAAHINGFWVPDYISITDFIFDCEDEFWNVIRHEYCHALVMLRDGKKHGHDAVWEAACREVGCKPERLASDEEAHKKSDARKAERARYEVVCSDCSRIFRYMRKSSVVSALLEGRTCTCPCGSHNLIFSRKP